MSTIDTSNKFTYVREHDRTLEDELSAILHAVQQRRSRLGVIE